MIEPTDEIQRAYAEAWFRAIGMDEPDVEQMVAAELRDPMPWRIAALKAVLAIVERDWNVQPRPSGSHLPCRWCRATVGHHVGCNAWGE